MILDQLTFRAVGPFVDETSIDFRSLNSSQLFLLDGPTGSGKSTILDAIVFALYGKTAGSATSDQRMRSDAADPEIEPFVELIFETSDGRYKVRRTPTYERPKKRGTGTTTAHASATLVRLTSPDSSDGGVPIATSVDEVGRAILDIVGLSRAQFSQTVVLPQGEFAEFLNASVEQRREVLQRLFSTEIYDQVTQELIEKSRSAKRELDLARNQVARCAAVLASNADISEMESEDIRDATNHEFLIDRCSTLVADVSHDHDEAKTASAKAVKEHSKRSSALVQAQKNEAARKRKANLLAQAELLAAAQSDYAQQCEQLKRLEIVSALGPIHAQLVESRHRQADSNIKAAAALDQAPQSVQEDPNLTRPLLRESVKQLAIAQNALQAESDTAAAIIRLDETDRQLQSAKQELTANGAAGRRLPQEISALTAARDKVLKLAATRDATLSAVASAQTGASAATLLRELTAAEKKCAKNVNKARDELVRATQDYANVRIARVNGMAAELAGTLIEDQPCVVCGSTTHPNPAASDSVVSAEDEEHAQQREIAAQRRLDECAAALADIQKQLAVATDACKGLSIKASEKQLADAEQAHRKALQAQEQLEKLDAELADLNSRQIDIDRKRDELSARKSELSAERSSLRKQIASLERQTQKAQGDFASISEAIGSLAEQIAVLESVESTQAHLAAASAEVVRSETRFSQELAKAKIASEAELCSQLALLDQLPSLRTSTEAHRQGLNAVADGLAEPDVAAADGDAAPIDLAELSADVDRALVERDAAAARLTTARNRLSAVTTAAQDLRAAIARADGMEKQVQPVIRMAELAAGTSPDNLLRMPLATYVLIERFKAVVSAANSRLQVMSSGRFELAHTTAREDRNRRSGLGLVVIDHETSRERDPRTLSGGEQFYVSLALALGLADTVTAESGGISLGTLFIDEGFGSLDPHTLDDVLAELTRLREGGRVVGVVSHVEELKIRIPDRIEVRRLSGGTSKATVIC